MKTYTIAKDKIKENHIKKILRDPLFYMSIIAVFALVLCVQKITESEPSVIGEYTVTEKHQLIGPTWEFVYITDNGCRLEGNYNIGDSVKLNKITCEVVK